MTFLQDVSKQKQINFLESGLNKREGTAAIIQTQHMRVTLVKTQEIIHMTQCIMATCFQALLESNLERLLIAPLDLYCACVSQYYLSFKLSGKVVFFHLFCHLSFYLFAPAVIVHSFSNYIVALRDDR